MTNHTTPARNVAQSGHSVAKTRDPTWITCGGCGGWTGLSTCHCSACHRTFTGITAFDVHRQNYRCLDPATICGAHGQRLVRVTKLHWSGWGLPGEYAACVNQRYSRSVAVPGSVVGRRFKITSARPFRNAAVGLADRRHGIASAHSMFLSKALST